MCSLGKYTASLTIFILLLNISYISSKKDKGVSKRHSRVKRTPPFPFGPPFVGPGFLGPRFGPTPFPGPPFGFEGPPRGFPPPFGGREIFERGGFRRPFDSIGFRRSGPGLSTVRSRGEPDRLSTAPVILETPDGTQTVFIRGRGARPSPTLSRGMQAGGGAANPIVIQRRGVTASRPRGQVVVMSTNPATNSNPLPTCTGGTILRCRPWPRGADPATAHQCYGDCPGRTCFVNCVCTCDTEQGPRIMLARMIGSGGGLAGSIARIALSEPASKGGDVSLPAGLVTSGSVSTEPIALPDEGLGISSEPVSMGIPIPMAETSASLPQLGVANVNLGTLPEPELNIGAVTEPEVAFVSTIDLAPSGNGGIIAGTAGSSVNEPSVVPLEGPSGKIEVNLKANDPSLMMSPGPAIDIVDTALDAAAQTPPDILFRPLPDSALSAASSGQSLPSFAEANDVMKPAAEFVNVATNPLALTASNIDTTIPGVADMSITGSDLTPLAQSLPAPGPAPAPPVNPFDINAANKNLLATLKISEKKDGSTAPLLNKSLQTVSSSTKNSNLPDFNALSSLLAGFTGNKIAQNSDLTKSAILSQLSGASTAPLSRLDLLAKNLGASELFSGGRIDPNVSLRTNSSSGGLLMDNVNTSMDAVLAAMLMSGNDGLAASLTGNTDQPAFMGLGTENENMAMLAALLETTGAQQNPFMNSFDRNGLNNQSFGSNNIAAALLSRSSLSGNKSFPFAGSGQQLSSGMIDSTGSILKPGVMKQESNTWNMTATVMNFVPVNGTKNTQGDTKTSSALHRNHSAAGQIATGATTKECLSKGLEIWCEPVGVWDNTPGVTKWCLLNCRDKNNCDRKRCACTCVKEAVFRLRFEKLPIKSP